MADESTCKELPDVPSAMSVDVDVCVHGNVSLVINDEDGKPMAVAHFTLGSWAALSNFAYDLAEKRCPDLLVAIAEASASEIDPTATKH